MDDVMATKKKFVLEGRAAGLSWNEIATNLYRTTGIQTTGSNLRKLSHKKGWTAEIAGVVDGSRHVKQKFEKQAGEITTKSLDLRTVQDVLDYAEVDENVWEVVAHEITTWEVTVGAKTSGTGNAQTYTNYRIHVRLKKIVEDPVEEALEDLLTELVQKDVRIPVIEKNQEGDVVMFMGLFDHHLGKLAWHRESGDDYDIPIAKKSFLNAVEDLLHRASVYSLDKIVFPIGNDFFQVDNFIDGKIGATAKGTPQDCDGRLAKIFRAGRVCVIEAIEMCAAVAPVEVVWVPGNHDTNTSYYLAEVIDAYFHGEERVSVDVGPSPRKYKRYGKVLVGLTHGNEEKHVDLPAIMAGEAKKDWAEADEYIWFLGHWHKRKEMRFNAGDTYGAVQIRVLPSLSGTDAWHHKKGYVNSARAAEAYLFHPDDGYLGHVSVNIRKDLTGDV